MTIVEKMVIKKQSAGKKPENAPDWCKKRDDDEIGAPSVTCLLTAANTTCSSDGNMLSNPNVFLWETLVLPDIVALTMEVLKTFVCQRMIVE